MPHTFEHTLHHTNPDFGREGAANDGLLVGFAIFQNVEDLRIAQQASVSFHTVKEGASIERQAS